MNHKKNVTFVTNKFSDGGTFYEKQVFESLKLSFNLNLVEVTDNHLNLIKSKKVNYFTFFLKKKLKKSDILITNNLFVYGLDLKKFRKKIFIFHHMDFSIESKLTNHFNYKILQNLAVFDLIVVPSKYWKNYLSNYVDKDRIKVIYNSFDKDFIKNAVSNFDRNVFLKDNNIPLDKFIIYAGNPLLVKGIKDVLNTFKDTKYYIVTSGNYQPEAKVHNINCTYTDYLRLIKSSDIVCLFSSFKEGWNRIAHESILCGKTVIGRRGTGGMEELINETNNFFIEDINVKDIIKLSKITPNTDLLAKYDLEYFSNEWNNTLRNLK